MKNQIIKYTSKKFKLFLNKKISPYTKLNFHISFPTIIILMELLKYLFK